MKHGTSIPSNSIRFIAIAILAAVLGITAAPALAGHYELIKTDIPDEGYSYVATPTIDAVCQAYEKNLNSFADEPYGMACGRKLNPAFGFTRPVWEPLDLLKHINLVQEIEEFLVFPPFSGRPVDPQRFAVALKEQEAQGLTLEIARVDLNGDGKPDNLIRFGWKGGCDASNRLIFSNPSGRFLLRLDSSLRLLKQDSKMIGLARENIFLFRGRLYSDAFSGRVISTKHSNMNYQAVLYLYSLSEQGIAPRCRFHYFDPNLTFAPENK